MSIKYLSYGFIAMGLLFLLIYIVMTISKIIRNKKGGAKVIFSAFIIGTMFLSAGAVLYFNPSLLTKDTVHETRTAKQESNASLTKEKSSSQQKQSDSFDSKGSVRPKVFYPNLKSWGDKGERVYTDADGTKTYVNGAETAVVIPQGIRGMIYDSYGAWVFVPDKDQSNGKGSYTSYKYSISDVDGEISIQVGKHVTFSKDLYFGSTPKSEQRQTFSADDNKAKMSYIDFIYKKFPLQKPKKTTDNPLLIGNWKYEFKDLLENKHTAIEMNFTDDGYVTVDTSLIEDLPSMAKYKLESLGKNAYKLYLYPATVKADSNGGGTSVADEPIKRNFLIYMNSKDSFDVVLFDDQLKRRELKMKRY
ncbi:hypothetical protein NIE88_09720 [Sporolactobacillus shoreicorticis]|uniref:DUF4767 domain-containing protein n=1 Tax=Sporolactobacillus shoreicorticis TaxID=1923877 RepID=A0ABW5SBR2_9BACL|nr:hypothetical protein [Sporolactobacillus shoreicorticis]MCO7126053.1 hypothetical protein [Sporolactobacillus shoreicorticis]